MGITYLFDTDTFIYLTKGNRHVLKKIQENAELTIKLSTISVSELYFGMYHSQRVEENLKKLESFLNTIEILDFDLPSAKRFGKLKQSLFEKRLTIDDFDLAIASIALTHHCTLITHNTKHFIKIPDLVIEDWVE